MGSTATRGGSSSLRAGSWFAISTSELASGLTVGSGLGLGVIVSTLSLLDSSVVGLSFSSFSLMSALAAGVTVVSGFGTVVERDPQSAWPGLLYHWSTTALR